MDQMKHDFKHVPKGYGEVAFYWWVGEKLTKERLLWQLDKLKDKAISGIQINYAHTDAGGMLWGLTIESDPPLFSDAWWELFGWFMKECKKYGIAVSLSDYTLGSAGQGYFVDDMLSLHPELFGQILLYEDGEVSVKTLENTYSPIQKGVGEAVIEAFYGKFEKHFPGECGKGLNFFFSDELNFGVSGNLWCDDFAEQFIVRKGYDIMPHLKALFEETGDSLSPQKVRLDYYDLIVILSEERYFKKIYNYHEERHMTFGCDHGGRGKDITEFGDYFRTMKWNQGPGNDQPALGSDIIKNKVSSSIAHLYERPRTWLEGFYGSGWGTSSGDVADATFRNFAMGHNLLTLHGLYYTTYGGWWEWAPPCNHFRMPYWAHMGEFLSCSERLSYLLSRGVHVCDVAIVYPVAAVEGGLDGMVSVDTAFSTAEYLYQNGVDFDFIDHESILRAAISERADEFVSLNVSGEHYKVIILPSMKTVRFGMLQKLTQFWQAGGMVICIGGLPEISEQDICGDTALKQTVEALLVGSYSNHVKTKEDAYSLIRRRIDMDFECDSVQKHAIYFQHRRSGTKDIYLLYGLEKSTHCTMRARGTAELWNPWTSEMWSLPIISQSSDHTTIEIPLTSEELQIIVFDATQVDSESQWKSVKVKEQISLDGPWRFELKPTLDNTYGDFRLPSFAGYIGAEARKISCKTEAGTWSEMSCGYGPRFMKMGPVEELESLVTQILDKSAITEDQKFFCGEKSYNFTQYAYSTRMGIEGDPGHQGYHGLKGEMSDDFIYTGRPEFTATSTEYIQEKGGDIYYFWSTVYARTADEVRVSTGEFAPVQVWMNGKTVDTAKQTLQLRKGFNTILLKYIGTGRGHFVLESIKAPDIWEQKIPLSMSWYNKPGVYAFDCRPSGNQTEENYCFRTPPACTELCFTVYGELQVTVEGRQIAAESNIRIDENSGCYKYCIDEVSMSESLVELKIRLEKGVGAYGGGTFIEPIQMNCAEGEIELGDWSAHEGLYSYSGGAYYRKKMILRKEQLEGVLVLDLGEVVSSVELTVNGRHVGIKAAPSWEFDITAYVREGENEIEALIYNTLANHYTSIPTRYRGNLKSGIIGPVQLKIEF